MRPRACRSTSGISASRSASSPPMSGQSIKLSSFGASGIRRTGSDAETRSRPIPTGSPIERKAQKPATSSIRSARSSSPPSSRQCEDRNEFCRPGSHPGAGAESDRRPRHWSCAHEAPSARHNNHNSGRSMYQQVYDPVADSLGLTSLFAAIPLTLMFVMLGVFKRSPQLSALVSLAATVAVATLVYPMPFSAALNSGLFGVAFALLTIAWILVNAMWIYNMTVETGYFGVLRESFCRISDDLRIQAIIIAYCFGALIEALAGSGVPIAICSAMLVAIGFNPVKAAVVALVADTAPVAFGALAVPITTLNRMTDLPYNVLGAMVGRQCPIIALVVPFVLVLIVDGVRGVRATWPAALGAGLAFALAQFVVSNFVAVPLSDIVASLVSAAAIVALTRVWSPKSIMRGG